MLKFADPGYIDNITQLVDKRLVTVRCQDGPKSIVSITPKDTTWPTWLTVAERYQLENEILIQVDIGPTGIQLSFKKTKIC